MASIQSKRDDYSCIELAGFLPDGKMLRDRFVRVDDTPAIDKWRHKFNNTDIFSSVCRHKKPDCQSDFIAPLFFDIDSPGNLTAARENALILCELIMTRLELDSDEIQICFSGHKGFHITVACEVFNPIPSELTLKLYKKMALSAQKQGIPFADTSVYCHRRLWRLVNSINGKSGLYKIPISHKELLHMSTESLAELARQSRDEDSFCIAAPNQHAIKWYKNALSCMKKINDRPVRNTALFATDFKHGWRVPPCIKNIQKKSLPDGVRHDAYLSLARFYSWINMHPQELAEKLHLLDQKNPIKDPDSIDRMIDWATEHPGFPGCENETLKRFCDEENCFYYSLKSGDKHGNTSTFTKKRDHTN